MTWLKSAVLGFTRNGQEESQHKPTAFWQRISVCWRLASPEPVSRKAVNQAIRRTTLFLFSHPRRESKPHQYSICIEKSAHSLAPRFLLVLNKHSISHRFKLCCGSLDTLHVELKPGVGRGQTIRPGAVTKTRLCSLGERPKGEFLYALQSIRVEIAATLFFEGNTEGLNVEFAARICIADDRPKTRDEQHLFFQFLHGISSSYGEGYSRSGQSGDEFSSRHASNDSQERIIRS